MYGLNLSLWHILLYYMANSCSLQGKILTNNHALRKHTNYLFGFLYQYELYKRDYSEDNNKELVLTTCNFQS